MPPITVDVLHSRQGSLDLMGLAILDSPHFELRSSSSTLNSPGLTDATAEMIVVGYRFPGGQTGLRFAEGRRKLGIDVPIVLWMHSPTPVIERAVRRVPNMSLLSTSLPIVAALTHLRSVAEGGVLSVGVREDPFNFSPAEFEALELLAAGFSPNQLADELDLSIHTVRQRIRGLMLKSRSASYTQAMLKAMTLGLVAPPESLDQFQAV